MKNIRFCFFQILLQIKGKLVTSITYARNIYLIHRKIINILNKFSFFLLRFINFTKQIFFEFFVFLWPFFSKNSKTNIFFRLQIFFLKKTPSIRNSFNFWPIFTKFVPKTSTFYDKQWFWHFLLNKQKIKMWIYKKKS